MADQFRITTSPCQTQTLSVRFLKDHILDLHPTDYPTTFTASIPLSFKIKRSFKVIGSSLGIIHRNLIGDKTCDESDQVVYFSIGTEVCSDDEFLKTLQKHKGPTCNCGLFICVDDKIITLKHDVQQLIEPDTPLYLNIHVDIRSDSPFFKSVIKGKSCYGGDAEAMRFIVNRHSTVKFNFFYM